MPVNPDIHYQKAEQEYLEADTAEKKIKALKKMMSLAPSHKGSEGLRKQLKTRLAKLKYSQEKTRLRKKGGKNIFSIKKEGAASIVILGVPNSGKSTVLKKLTNADVKIAPYPFTTIKPEQGVLNYKGIKIQLIELPGIVESMELTEHGLSIFSIIRNANLVLIIYEKKEEITFIKQELKEADLDKPIISITKKDTAEHMKEIIWKSLELIKVYTKQPGKKADYPPVALKKGSTITALAERIHKDFAKKFRYAKVWGASAKFPGQTVGLEHVLQDEDQVELHMK